MYFLLSMPGGAEWLLLIFAIILIALPIWAIVDIIKSTFKQPDDKLLLMLLVIFVPLVGSLIYYFIGSSRKVDEYRKSP